MMLLGVEGTRRKRRKEKMCIWMAQHGSEWEGDCEARKTFLSAAKLLFESVRLNT